MPHSKTPPDLVLEKVNLEDLDLELEIDSEVLEFFGNFLRISSPVFATVLLQLFSAFPSQASPSPTRRLEEVAQGAIVINGPPIRTPRHSSERHIDESLKRSDSVLLEENNAMGEGFINKPQTNIGHAKSPSQVDVPRVQNAKRSNVAKAESEPGTSSTIVTKDFIATNKVTMDTSIPRDIRPSSTPIIPFQEQLLVGTAELAKLQVAEQLKASIKVRTTGPLIAENCIGTAISTEEFSLPNCELNSCTISFDAHFVTKRRGPTGSIACLPPFTGPRLFEPVYNTDLMDWPSFEMKASPISPILSPTEPSSSRPKHPTNKITAKVIKTTNDYGAFELHAELENTFTSNIPLKNTAIKNPVQRIKVNLNVTRSTVFTEDLSENRTMSIPNANNYRAYSDNNGKTLKVEVARWHKGSAKGNQMSTTPIGYPEAIGYPKEISPISPRMTDSLIQEGQNNSVSATSFL